jgi:raffinose/stachyose/melibiose transport system permease protein
LISPIFKKNIIWIVLFLLPVTVLFAGIIIIPLLQSFYNSFFQWNGIKITAFRGFENYAALFSARELGMSMKNSVIYGLFIVVCQVGLGVLLSFILTTARIKGKLIYRNIYFIPVLLSVSVSSQLWIWIYHGDYGLINKLAEVLGLLWRQNWLNQKGASLIAVAVSDVWKGFGYIFLIIYTGMRNIPNVYFEASCIDGASPFKQFLHISLPLTAPTIRITVVMCLTYGFRAFEIIYLMTGGGPGIYTYNLTILMYKAMFSMNDFGYGSAIAMVIVVICVGLMLGINRLTRKFDEIY